MIKNKHKFGINHFADEIIRDYEEINDFEYLAEKYGFSVRQIKGYLKLKLGLDIHEQRVIDYNPFVDLDNPEVQYWLGFITADGCVYGDRLSISSAAKDEEILIKFNKFLGNKLSIINVDWKQGFRIFNGNIIQFRNKEVCEFLRNLGITSNKSLTVKLNFKITRHFLRGLIDGDGSYDFNSESIVKKYRIRFATASYRLLLQVFEFYLENELYARYYRDIQLRKNPMHEIVISHKEDVLKLLELLYNNADVYLERKYQKAQQIRNYLQQTP